MWYLQDLCINISQTPNLTCFDGHLSVLYPYHTPAVMAQPIEPTGTAADPLAALTAALKLLLPNQLATTLQTPTFEWTISDQYDEFKLFQESMES